MDRRFSSRRSRRLRSVLWRARFVVAAACCGLAAAGVTQALRPPSPLTVPVVVTARGIEAGSSLGSADVRVVGMPAALVPDDAASSVADVTGRTASVPLPAGLPVVPDLVAAGDLVSSAPGGTVVAPVRLDPAVAALLSPGVRVDLLAASEWSPVRAAEIGDPAVVGTSETGADDPYLARSAVVLPRGPARDDGGLLGGDTGTGEITLVAVAPHEAVRLAAVSGWAGITAVVVP